MCGIVCVFNIRTNIDKLHSEVLKMSKTIRHRGPDWSGIFSCENAILAHERLAIVDPTSGGQPIVSNDGNLILAINGEIYNHLKLRKNLTYDFQTKSDCEVILPLYEKYGIECLNELGGMFGFALYDKKKNTYLIARDHLGIIPLYMGWDEKGQFYVASELKALEGTCSKIESFPPGHYLLSGDKAPKKWYSRNWTSFDAVKDNQSDASIIRMALEHPCTAI